MKAGTTFLYDGKSSSEYGVIVGGSGTIDSYDMGLNRSIIAGDINRFRTQVNHIGAKYSNVLSFSFSIVKDPCVYHGDNMYFTRQEIRNLNAWLTSQQYPKVLYFPDDEEDIFFFAVISSVDSDVANTKVFMLTYEVTCNAPWGFSAMKEETSLVGTETKVLNRDLVITNTSDDIQDYIYPTIIITPYSSGTVTITNNSESLTTGNSMTINVNELDTVTIDCRLCTFKNLSGTLSLSDLGFTDAGYVHILRFKNGDNNISISGDADVTFRWREPRKVGIA